LTFIRSFMENSVSSTRRRTDCYCNDWHLVYLHSPGGQGRALFKKYHTTESSLSLSLSLGCCCCLCRTEASVHATYNVGSTADVPSSGATSLRQPLQPSSEVRAGFNG